MIDAIIIIMMFVILFGVMIIIAMLTMIVDVKRKEKQIKGDDHTIFENTDHDDDHQFI